MAAPNARLATSLTALQDAQRSGRRVFGSQEFTRIHRERLIENGFLQEVIKGWLISTSPEVAPGETTQWYASFWEFCASYSEERFGDEWYLSPEQSLMLHAENTVVPTQVIIHSPRATNNKVPLPFGASLYDLKQPEMPPAPDLTVRAGLRLFFPAAAVIRVSAKFFHANPIEAGVVLAGIGDVSELLRRLLDGGHSVVAGRLAGALRRIGRAAAADEIVTTMKAAGYDIRETDPFAEEHVPLPSLATAAPIVGRMRAMWETMRRNVVEIFPKPPGLPQDRDGYLESIDESYRSDAYNSLSIEGYTVTGELIERVGSGDWDPDNREADRQSRDALAARGYWQAFQSVKAGIVRIVNGENAACVVRTAHRDWYRELFQPCVRAGLVAPSALAGYRNDAVYLRNSRFVPPRWEAVRDAMPALFDLLENEPEPGVRAVLGHWLFGYIHPYPDGNGRLARFLMNAMLASGGYRWTIIRVQDRAPYLAALDRASVDMDILPFAKFIAERVPSAG
jgi:hypothetical protein